MEMHKNYSITQHKNYVSKISVAHQYIALLTLPDCSLQPMETDPAYQGCFQSFELHSIHS